VRRFDFGNSPSGIEAAGLAPGAVVVLSTTNGTRVLEAAHGAPAILAGAFVSRFTDRSALYSGGRQLLLGAAATAVTYGIGSAVGTGV